MKVIKVIKENGHENFEKKVNEYLEKGWRIIGSPKVLKTSKNTYPVLFTYFAFLEINE